MKIIKHIEPPIKDKLKAHYFDRYRPSIEGNKILSSVGDQSEGREIQPGRCYDFDGVDDYIAITSPDIGTLYVSGLDENGELNTTLTIGYFTNQYQISGSGKVWNIKVWTSNTATETQKKSYTLESGLFAWYKCDEGAGINSYDSSGNGHHGTIVNASLETFHSTQNIHSWHNEVGYSIGKSFSINATDTVNSINEGGSTVYNIPGGGTYWFNTSDELDPDGEPVNVWTEDGLNIYRSSNTSGVESATSQLFRLQRTVVSGRFIIRSDIHQGTINRISYRYRGYYENFRTQHNLTFGELPSSSLTVEQFYYALSGDHPEHGEQYPETVLGLSGATSSQYRDVLFNAGIEDPILFTDLLGTSNIFLTSPGSPNYDYTLTPIVDFNPNINTNNSEIIFNTNDLYATGQLGNGTTGYFNILQRSLPTIGNFFLASTQPIWFKLKQFSFDSTTIIPRNESNPSKDVLGNDLEYKGQVAYNAILKQSNCLHLDGIDDIIQFADTTGWNRLENAGTSELSINGNNIEGTEGSVYNLRVYDSSDNLIHLFPCSEGGGTIINCVLGGTIGTLMNATIETVWTKQDEYHFNLEHGWSSGTNDEKIPSSLTNHNQDATGLPLENIAGRHHNGAETLIDFTGGVESPYAVQFELPNNYAFGDPIEYKEEANNIEKNILIYEGVDSGEDIRIKNFIKDI